MEQLVNRAMAVQGEFDLRDEFSAGAVGAALRTKAGNIYTGVCIEMACGIGFCAEHAAIAEMLKHRETEIEAVVAVSARGIIPPCGRCREMIMQIDRANRFTKIAVSKEKVMRLQDLLPHWWFKQF